MYPSAVEAVVSTASKFVKRPMKKKLKRRNRLLIPALIKVVQLLKNAANSNTWPFRRKAWNYHPVLKLFPVNSLTNIPWLRAPFKKISIWIFLENNCSSSTSTLVALSSSTQTLTSFSVSGANDGNPTSIATTNVVSGHNYLQSDQHGSKSSHDYQLEIPTAVTAHSVPSFSTSSHQATISRRESMVFNLFIFCQNIYKTWLSAFKL